MATRARIAASLGGFTLIEAMLTVALLAILIALAMPSYQGLMRRAHRTEAIGQLMQVAACQERIRAGSGAYDPTRCLPPDSDHYDYRYAAGEAVGPRYFQAAALPVAAQAADPCGELRYDSLGLRSASGGDARRCWAGR